MQNKPTSFINWKATSAGIEDIGRADLAIAAQPLRKVHARRRLFDYRMSRCGAHLRENLTARSRKAFLLYKQHRLGSRDMKSSIRSGTLWIAGDVILLTRLAKLQIIQQGLPQRHAHPNHH